MIKTLRIRNFQSHKDTFIEFDPGVNVITGPNMSGKSAILRAIRLVISNQPGGSEFISWDASKSEVTLECNDSVITRIKGNRTNEYILDGSTFSGFGRAIPEEISRALGTVPIYIDDRPYELNYADAHASPFLVSETDSVKGKLFTQLASSLLGDLSRLDSAITSTNSRVRAARIEERLTVEGIADEKIKLASFEALTGVDKKLTMCHTLLDNAQAIEVELDTLNACHAELLEAAIEIGQLDKLLAALDLDELRTQEEQIRSLMVELDELKRLDTLYKQTDLEVKRLKRWEAKDIDTIESQCSEAITLAAEIEALKDLYSDLDLYNISVDRDNALCVAFSDIPIMDSVNAIYAKLLTVKQFHAELTSYAQRQKHEQHLLDIIEDHLIDAIAELTTLLTENKKCPVCLSAIDEARIASILQEITNGSRDAHRHSAGCHS